MFLSQLAARERELIALNEQLDSEQAAAAAEEAETSKLVAQSTFRLTEASAAVGPSTPPRAASRSSASPAAATAAMSPSTKAAAVASARRRNRGVGRDAADSSPLARQSPSREQRGRSAASFDRVDISGLGAEAESRVLAARIKALEKVIAEKKRTSSQLKPKVAAARKQSEAVEEQRALLQAKATRAEEQIADARGEAEEHTTMAAKYEEELLALQRSSRASSRGAARGTSSSATDVRLNRVLTKIDETRKLLERERSQGGSESQRVRLSLPQRTALPHRCPATFLSLASPLPPAFPRSPGASERLARTQESVRVLEKHRSELLAALRKQARLVDVLRRQTMMIEAANTLSFTEREFEDVMDLAAAAGSW